MCFLFKTLTETLESEQFKLEKFSFQLDFGIHWRQLQVLFKGTITQNRSVEYRFKFNLSIRKKRLNRIERINHIDEFHWLHFKYQSFWSWIKLVLHLKSLELMRTCSLFFDKSTSLAIIFMMDLIFKNISNFINLTNQNSI